MKPQQRRKRGNELARLKRRINQLEQRLGRLHIMTAKNLGDIWASLGDLRYPTTRIDGKDASCSLH